MITYQPDIDMPQHRIVQVGEWNIHIPTAADVIENTSCADETGEWFVPDVYAERFLGQTAVENNLGRPTLSERFKVEAEKWGKETRHLSSPAQQMMHPSYQAILGMAAEDTTEVVRLMIRDLQQNRRPWFWALSYLTHQNPISRADAGKTDRMINAWADWGRKNNLS